MPAELPDRFASRALIVHGRFSGTAEGPIVVSGKGANGRVEIPVRVVSVPATDGWPITALLSSRVSLVVFCLGVSFALADRARGWCSPDRFFHCGS
jgi:hypothetical protein